MSQVDKGFADWFIEGVLRHEGKIAAEHRRKRIAQWDDLVSAWHVKLWLLTHIPKVLQFCLLAVRVTIAVFLAWANALQMLACCISMALPFIAVFLATCAAANHDNATCIMIEIQNHTSGEVILSQESAHAMAQGFMGGVKLANVLLTHIYKVIFLDLATLDPVLNMCPDVQVAGIYYW